MFDFTNYTFSGLLSILASIYGIGYPIIVQSIRSIYNQYDSNLLSHRFSKEPVYIAFQTLMIVNMVVAVLAPFLLQSDWHNQIVITVQAVLMVALIGCSIMLFQLILLFSNAEDLLDRVVGRQIDQNNVMEILDIAIYADAQHNADLYFKSLSHVFSYIFHQQGNNDNESEEEITTLVVYDGVTVEIVRKLKGFIRMDDGHHFLYGNNDITSILYNSISSSRLSLQCHQMMWMFINEAIEFNNHTWFNQYWQYADSYTSMKYRFISFESPLRQDRQIFIIRHVMIGGMLLHYGRIEWLNDVFFFTHSEPEYYGLIPSTFGDIVEIIELIDKMCSDIEYFNQQGFYYHDQMSGVNDNKYFFRDALKYLSLLVIRLWSLEGRGYTKDRLFNLPPSPLKIEDDERDARMMEMLRTEVAYWYESGVFANIPRMKAVDKKDVDTLLENYQHQCESDRKIKKEHPIVDKEKYKILCQGLEAEADRVSNILPSNDVYERGVTIISDIIRSYELDTINYSSFFDIGCSCVPNVHFSNFWNEIAVVYLQNLGQQKLLKDFKVPRTQIQQMLFDLELNDDYVIIATEKIDGLPESAIVLQVKLAIKLFFVVKKVEVPQTTLLLLDNNELEPIEGASPICSNIEGFKDYNDPVYNLILGTRFRFSIPNNFGGYVRFVVDYASDTQKITTTKTFDELFERS